MQIPVISSSISHEMNFLCDSFLLGIVITFVYDNIRVLRRVIKHTAFFVSCEDLLFWVSVSFCIFTLQYYVNNGIFRWFSIIGAFLGMSLYKLLISRFYVTYLTKILKWFLHILYLILAAICRPIFYIEDKVSRKSHKMWKKWCHIIKYVKNRLTQRIKLIKITLCKQRKCSGKKVRQSKE